MPSLNRLLFFMLIVICPAVWIGTVKSWETSFWYMVVVLAFAWIIFTVYDALRSLWTWLNRETRVELQIYDQEQDRAYSASEIIDAEVIEETERKWWRV